MPDPFVILDCSNQDLRLFKDQITENLINNDNKPKQLFWDIPNGIKEQSDDI